MSRSSCSVTTDDGCEASTRSGDTDSPLS
jgi:hypothetical protein